MDIGGSPQLKYSHCPHSCPGSPGLGVLLGAGVGADSTNCIFIRLRKKGWWEHTRLCASEREKNANPDYHGKIGSAIHVG